MAKAGSAYVDIDANLDKMRATLASGTAHLTAEVELDPDMQDLRAKLRAGHLMTDLGLDIDRTQIAAQLAGLTTNLRLDVDRTDIAMQLAALGVNVNVSPDYSSLMWTRNEIIAYLSGIWVDVNVRIDATTLATLQAQLAALSAQAGMIGSGAAGGAAAAGGVGMGALLGGAAVVGGAAAIGIGATIGLGAYGAQIAADNETAQMSFERLLGSEEAALDYLAQLRDFAAKTPFDFPGIRDSAAKFLAVGVEADRVIPIMTTLGDATAAMGTGALGVDRATYALVQMSQKGFVSAEDMMQLTDAGIPAWDALAAKIGVSVPEAMDRVTKKLVPASTMFDAIEEKSGSAFGRVTGGMEEASTSLTGLLATMKDEMDALLGEVVEPLLPVFKEMIGPLGELIVPLIRDHLGPALERMMPMVETLMEGFAPFLGLFIDFGAQLVESMQPAMEVLMPLLVDLAEQLAPKMEEIMPELAEAFVAIAEAMVELAPFIPPTIDLMTGITVLTANALEAVASAFAWIADILAGPMAATLGEVLGMMGDLTFLDWDGARARAEGWIDGLMEAFPRMINWLIEQWNRLDFSFDFDIPDILGGGSVHTGDMIPDIQASFGVGTIPRAPNPVTSTQAASRGPGIRAFHEGGVFTAPQGGEGLALLRNNEVVFTPEQMQAMSRSGGSSTPVENHLYIDGREFAVIMTQLADRREKAYG